MDSISGWGGVGWANNVHVRLRNCYVDVTFLHACTSTQCYVDVTFVHACTSTQCYVDVTFLDACTSTQCYIDVTFLHACTSTQCYVDVTFLHACGTTSIMLRWCNVFARLRNYCTSCYVDVTFLHACGTSSCYVDVAFLHACTKTKVAGTQQINRCWNHLKRKCPSQMKNRTGPTINARFWDRIYQWIYRHNMSKWDMTTTCEMEKKALETFRRLM